MAPLLLGDRRIPIPYLPWMLPVSSVSEDLSYSSREFYAFLCVSSLDSGGVCILCSPDGGRLQYWWSSSRYRDKLRGGHRAEFRWNSCGDFADWSGACNSASCGSDCKSL